MRVQSLLLHNFRNHKRAFFEFDSGLNTFCGPNAAGKTNILEALFLCVSGRSFRHSALQECICKESESFFVHIDFVKQGIEQTIKIACSKNEKKILYNTTPLHSFTGLIGILQGTVLTPDDANLIKGPPPLRRQFLDLLIAQNDPLYIHYATRYHKAMLQRNCTLRKRDGKGALCWEEEMANASDYIWKKRGEALKFLQESCQHFHHLLVEAPTPLELTFKSFAATSRENTKQKLLDAFEKNRKREMELGFTLTGPHRDDFIIRLDGQEARFFASEGQQRTMATVLRLGEWEQLKNLSQEKPLMIIDDIGLGLDEQRKNRLLNHLTHLGQVFVSTTHPLPISNRIHHICSDKII